MLKNLKGPPFTVFGIVRFFKKNNFHLEIRFSQSQHAISDFCSFQTGVFSKKKHRLLNLFHRNQTFCEREGLSALCDLPETFIKIFFEKFRIFFLNFLFFFEKMFSVEKDGFRDLCVSLRVFFGAVKLMKF